jgi:predicted CXXCH cytochrome family protein
MRFTLLVALLVSFALCFAQPPAAERKIPAAKAEIQFKTTTGTVTFKHEAHATKYAVACQTCHHTLQPSDAAPKACSGCHQKAGTPKMPTLQNAVHKKCWDCHKAELTKGKKAPQQAQCTGCHVKPKV